VHDRIEPKGKAKAKAAADADDGSSN